MSEREMVQLWRSLSDPQRWVLLDLDYKHHTHYISSMRVLDRLGLAGPGGYHTPRGARLVEWAVSSGNAYLDPATGNPVFKVPPSPSRIDLRRLAELAGAGHHGAQIARMLGVTRQAVDYAAKREGITLPQRPKRERPAARRREPHLHKLTVPLTAAEMAAVRKMSADAGVSMAELVRQRLLKESA